MSNANSDTVPIRGFPQSDRSQEVDTKFAARYKKNPDFYIRVPGRVNLIGEHVDYCGYGVCPMALEQDVFLAVSVEKDPILRLHNMDKQYTDFECNLKNLSISVGDGAPEWHQYFLCGIKGIFDILPKDVDFKGMNVVVSGKVPLSAGLSSSSALVSAAALATAHAHNFPMSKEKIANLCAECERYIGTQGGGMDQAIAFLATEGCAKLIEFGPLRSTDITLPGGAVFVIAHSLAKLNKAATADFNCRVVECRLAGQIIAKKRGLEWASVKRLGDLQQALKVDLSEMITIVEETLHEEPYTKEEVIRELETTSDHLNDTSLTQNTRHIQTFKLRQRALHVFREARRVELFHSICNKPMDGTTLATLGRLMTDSHESLRDLYECSHPQLDRLVELSRELTFGARLTGAGWGGCAVALVPQENLDKYMKTLKEKYYAEHKPKEINSVLFATSPKAGACIFIKSANK
jgi:N-acetylgalactosamine kinase